MKILLINNNPVVSRLTALSARKEDIEIDEIQEVTELNTTKYDIVFVDADSLSKDVENAISDNINAQKKVLFYAQDDTEDSSSFDMSILKPFLPSEVSAVIRSVDEHQEKEMTEETLPVETAPLIEESSVEEPSFEKKEEEKSFDILSKVQETKRDDLFDLDLTPIKEEKSNELTDALDNIELTDEINPESFDLKLKEAFPSKSVDLDDELFTEVTEDMDKELNEKIELFEVDLKDEKTPLNEELFIEEKKENSDELFDFDFEKKEELDFDKIETIEIEKGMIDIEKDVNNDINIEKDLIEKDINTEKEVLETLSPKIEEKEKLETKILDQSEIANIKEILNEKEEVLENVELDDLMTTVMPLTATENIYVDDKKEDRVETKEKVETQEAKEEVKKENTISIDSETAVETLQNLPIESLRELLAGARINISIKFPKAK